MSRIRTLSLAEFRSRFRALRKRGLVPSRRRGPTGVGHTLEVELELPENNVALPDIGRAEIKAHRANSTSMITLFTFNRKTWLMKPIEAVKKYGLPDENGRLGLYFTMSAVPNSAGLFVRFEEEHIDLRHIDGTLIASWPMSGLAQRFRQKLPALILVTAEVEERSGMEYFNYVRAQILSGVTATTLAHNFRVGNIVLDLRLHDKGTHARNHGTGFRAYEGRLPQLFARVKEI